MDADFERATGPWEIEWIVLPEAFCHTAGALAQARFMLGGLEVHPDAMSRDLHLTQGLVNTEAVMMALAPKMGPRDRARPAVAGLHRRGRGQGQPHRPAEPGREDFQGRSTAQRWRS